MFDLSEYDEGAESAQFVHVDSLPDLDKVRDMLDVLKRMIEEEAHKDKLYEQVEHIEGMVGE